MRSCCRWSHKPEPCRECRRSACHNSQLRTSVGFSAWRTPDPRRKRSSFPTPADRSTGSTRPPKPISRQTDRNSPRHKSTNSHSFRSSCCPTCPRRVSISDCRPRYTSGNPPARCAIRPRTRGKVPTGTDGQNETNRHNGD